MLVSWCLTVVWFVMGIPTERALGIPTPFREEARPRDALGIPTDSLGILVDSLGILTDSLGMPKDSRGIPKDSQSLPLAGRPSQASIGFPR